jgi:fructose-1,6-bisphosphatase I
MDNKITLTQFMIAHQSEFPSVSGDFTALLNAIAITCKSISYWVNQGDLIGVLGNAETENVQGEVQKKLDIISHDLMVEALNETRQVAGMVSEEAELPIKIPQAYPRGHYLAFFDPLDGSSNIDLNLTVGTIFSILHCQQGRESLVAQDFLRLGTAQVCAGFVLYGPATMMILTTGQGVNSFTLDSNIGEFILTRTHLKIPQDTCEFAINMSNQRFWEAPVQRYVNECVEGEAGVRGKNFNMRWIASLVAEVYRILIRGGIFIYPLDSHQSPSGRLRLLYEANPIALIVEQAGGVCSTGRKRILAIEPKHIHQRVPLVLGSKHEVERLIHYHLDN